MGIEIGPNGHLYYVDNGKDEVVRIDAYLDQDADGVVTPSTTRRCQPRSVGPRRRRPRRAADNGDDDDSVLGVADAYWRELNWTSTSKRTMTDNCLDSVGHDDDNDGGHDFADSARRATRLGVLNYDGLRRRRPPGRR